MSLKVIKIALAILGVFIVIGAIVFFILRNRDNVQTLTTDDGETVSFIGNLPQSGNINNAVNTIDQPNILGVEVTDPGFTTQVISEDLKRRSRNFIERLGSYSSDSSLSNFDDVLPQTTATLELDLRNLKKLRLQEFSETKLFVGYTVTAVTTNANLQGLDEGGVEVTINAIREVTGLNSPTGITDRELYVIGWTLGEDGQWRVHGISGDF